MPLRAFGASERASVLVVRRGVPASICAARSPHEWEQLYVEHMTTQCGPDWKPSWERADLEAKCAADPQAVAAELLEAA